MRWSKYNKLFESAKYGWLLYNSLSNTFCKVSPELKKEIDLIQEDPDAYDFNHQLSLYIQFRQSQVLVEDGEEEDTLNIRKLKWNYQSFSGEYAGLTIAPSWRCNFACPYCYQNNDNNTSMNDKTEEDLLQFIQRLGNIRAVLITWFGGEPTLEFKRIRSITEKLHKMEIRQRASMITNGYLLDEDKINELNDLNISFIQITIDGGRESHDQRRPLKSGKGTYNRIMENLDALLSSEWKGKINLRVNLDKSNKDQFVNVYKNIYEKYSNDRLNITPGIVWDKKMQFNPELSCSFQRDEEAALLFDLVDKYDIVLPNYFYPNNNKLGCIATNRNGFVVGPTGDLYKCWHDAGQRQRCIGTLSSDSLDLSVISKYMVGVNCFEDSECRNCFFLPVCDGGCSERRLENKYHNGKNDNCLLYKDHLPAFLENYYEWKVKEKGK